MSQSQFDKTPGDIPANKMPAGKSLGSGHNIAKRHGFAVPEEKDLGDFESLDVYEKDLATYTED